MHSRMYAHFFERSQIQMVFDACVRLPRKQRLRHTHMERIEPRKIPNISHRIDHVCKPCNNLGVPDRQQRAAAWSRVALLAVGAKALVHMAERRVRSRHMCTRQTVRQVWNSRTNLWGWARIHIQASIAPFLDFLAAPHSIAPSIRGQWACHVTVTGQNDIKAHSSAQILNSPSAAVHSAY